MDVLSRYEEYGILSLWNENVTVTDIFGNTGSSVQSFFLFDDTSPVLQSSNPGRTVLRLYADSVPLPLTSVSVGEGPVELEVADSLTFSDSSKGCGGFGADGLKSVSVSPEQRSTPSCSETAETLPVIEALTYRYEASDGFNSPTVALREIVLVLDGSAFLRDGTALTEGTEEILELSLAEFESSPPPVPLVEAVRPGCDEVTEEAAETVVTPCGDFDGSPTPLITVLRRWTVTSFDTQGVSRPLFTQTVRVFDNAAPNVTLNGVLQMQTEGTIVEMVNASSEGPLPSPPTVVATDNNPCFNASDPDAIVQSTTETNTSCPAEGEDRGPLRIINRTLEVTDLSGNKFVYVRERDSCYMQQISEFDDTPPSVLPGDDFEASVRVQSLAEVPGTEPTVTARSGNEASTPLVQTVVVSDDVPPSFLSSNNADVQACLAPPSADPSDAFGFPNFTAPLSNGENAIFADESGVVVEFRQCACGFEGEVFGGFEGCCKYDQETDLLLVLPAPSGKGKKAGLFGVPNLLDIGGDPLEQWKTPLGISTPPVPDKDSKWWPLPDFNELFDGDGEGFPVLPGKGKGKEPKVVNTIFVQVAVSDGCGRGTSLPPVQLRVLVLDRLLDPDSERDSEWPLLAVCLERGGTASMHPQKMGCTSGTKADCVKEESAERGKGLFGDMGGGALGLFGTLKGFEVPGLKNPNDDTDWFPDLASLSLLPGFGDLGKKPKGDEGSALESAGLSSSVGLGKAKIGVDLTLDGDLKTAPLDLKLDLEGPGDLLDQLDNLQLKRPGKLLGPSKSEVDDKRAGESGENTKGSQSDEEASKSQSARAHEWKFVVRVVLGVGGQMGQLEGTIRDRLIPVLMKGRRNGGPSTQHDVWLRDVAALPVRLLGLGIPKPTKTVDRDYKTSAAASEAITEAILRGEDIDVDEHMKRGQKARAAHKEAVKEAVEKEWKRLGSQSG
uniref:Uncharacterized protein n=1 Tax=Chromera velia CCMP2878 TaxID=1169474 RepID=A0A0G4FRS3_9ALVE|eukprot:Cvel_18266.t1-p1 / transcript=Cvel_18266.t1 / gene=Cvel_18266 / organism=Chromera_velia_CCMP2878 / gene_product=hypothetical protein / transcript_product=hypothetical protein / location=Cvel_scaffold1504:28672-37075(+) / protein_length=952 / sequence_SO=supercontig / SO=protein_coding / is_pseudo=false